MSKTIREDIIKTLANGDFVSGQALGKQMNISRMAISKHIKVLIDMGLDIYSVKGKGYKLSQSISLLNKNAILDALPINSIYSDIEVHSVIDSTNSYLLRRLPNQLSQGQVCLAEFQSAGRGRRGRQWVSPFGSQIYLSVYWYLEQGLSAAMGLNLVAALAVSDAIAELTGIQVQLKWPNDIYLAGVKLAGILIDLEGQALEPSHSIIGIGLNLNMPSQAGDKIDQKWTDLQSHYKSPLDRNVLCAKLIYYLWKRLQQHQNEGLSAMLAQWHKQDFYLNKRVKLITGERITKGICRGVNAQGALLLELDGQLKAIYGGEVSLRGDL